MRKISLYSALKITLCAVFSIHAFYLCIFSLMGEEILAVTNVFSVAIYFFLVRLICDSSENSKLVMVILQLEILFHIVTEPLTT